MALSFPANPVVGQPYYSESKYWIWDGYAWKVDNPIPIQQPNIYSIDGQGAQDLDTEILLTDTTSTTSTTSTIKTINGESILGTGNLELVSAANGTADNLTLVNGTADNLTLVNGTADNLTLNSGYTEQVFAVTGTTPAISPTNGSIQTWTLSANSTPTAGTWAAGQSITLLVDDDSAFSITWTSLAVTWKTDGGSAPTLNTTGYTVIVLWKVDTTIYGAKVGDA